jgi:outer membrane protein OmpA-like peptidoglycan-associated protein
MLMLQALLAGCSTTPSLPWPTSPGPSGPGGAGQPPPPVSPLVAEQRWLEEWFRGTPVVIAMADGNTLAVDVPLVHSFAVGRSSVKPALAAVLDRVATSLHRQQALLVSIAAPDDPGTSNMALASARAQQVRRHLVSRGVPTTRVSSVGTARAGEAVQLRLVTTRQAIGRFDDALPSPGVAPR